MEFSVYNPLTERLETVISNLASRDELRKQQLCSVPKKSEFLGLQSESGLVLAKRSENGPIFAKMRFHTSFRTFRRENSPKKLRKCYY